MHTMKTAISLEDELLLQADRTAREMGVSRSRLFSIALQAYLRKRRNREILNQLNKAYADEPSPAERRTVAGIKRGFRSTIREGWRA
jgi:metal-responsive CopG/Arc/MetJ family transcriptional regulator